MNRKKKALALAAAGLFAVAVSLGITFWALRYQARSGTEAPNAADWLQGWGTIFGLVITTVGAVVAGLVYYESVKAARVAEARRLEDRAEAEKAAKDAASRWESEQFRAMDAARDAERRWRDELEETRLATRAAEQRANDEQAERRRLQEEAELVAPRAFLVTRVAPSMAGLGQVGSISVNVFNFGTQLVRRINCLVTIKTTAAQARMKLAVVGPDAPGTLSWHSVGPPHLAAGGREAPIWELEDESFVWTVTVRFLDANGQAWERVDNGEPQKVASSDVPIPNINQ